MPTSDFGVCGRSRGLARADLVIVSMRIAARRVGIEVNVLVGVVQEATSWTTRPVVAPRACAGCIAAQLARCRIHALSVREEILACLQVVDGTAATGAAVRTKITVRVGALA